MTEIPVVWLSLHKSEGADTIPRGYWDQAMIEDAFGGVLGSTAPFTFRHFVVHAEPGDDRGQWPVADGVVVVIGARHHADRVDVINERLANYAWSIVLLTGDEEGVFPWDHLNANSVIMRQTPLIVDGGVQGGGWWFGDGYTPGTREIRSGGGYETQYMAKPLDWFFSGQITHERRRDCANVFARMGNGSFVATEGFTQGLDPWQYHLALAGAKIAPCPSGPVSVDTFRVFEALECGCVPIVDGRSPKYSQHTYWPAVFGAVPFPIVDDWRDAPGVVADILSDWPAEGNRCFAWWQLYKRQFRDTIIDAIIELRTVNAIPTAVPNPDALITVLVVSSPIEGHPDTSIIENTIASIRDRLPTADILVMFDGVRTEQHHLRPQYEEYQRRMLWKMQTEWTGVYPVRWEDHRHQSWGTRSALELVDTPLLLFVEHDTPLIGDIPFVDLTAPILSGEANVIRFHHEAGVHPEHAHFMTEDVPNPARSVPLLGTMQWSQRPHLASTQFYREIMAEFFGATSRTMIEDTMHGVLDYGWNKYGYQVWAERWRTFLYAPEGSMVRSLHTDGRGSEPKYEQVFEYDGDHVPEGAPYPTSLRPVVAPE